MDSENYFKLVMINPIKGDCIYKTKDIKKAGKKAFSHISRKYKINKSLITLLDLNTNKEYKFIAMKPPFENNQTGGGSDENLNQITHKLESLGGAGNNTEFMNKLKNITKTIDESLGNLDDAIEEKQKKDDDNNIILIARDGVSKLDEINKKLELINEKIDNYQKGDIKENDISKQKEDEEDSKDLANQQDEEDQPEDEKKDQPIELPERKREEDKLKKIIDDDNLLQPLIPPFEGDNLCIIM